MTTTKSINLGREQTSATAIAEHMRAIAALFEAMGEDTFPTVWLDFGFQLLGPSAPWPARRAAADRIAAALGAEMRQSDGLYSSSNQNGAHVYTTCPPPVEKRREELLAQLAQLDAEEAAEKPAAPVFEPGELDGIAVGTPTPVVTPHPDASAPSATALARQGSVVCARCGGVAPEHRRGCDARELKTAPKYDESGFEIPRFRDRDGDVWWTRADGSLEMLMFDGKLDTSPHPIIRESRGSLTANWGPLVEVNADGAEVTR